MTTSSSRSTSSSQAAASGEITKATLTHMESNESVGVMFNPTEYSMSKSNSWDPVKIVGSNIPRLEFTSGGSTELSLELLFDTYESGVDVRDHTNKIYKMTQIDSSTVDSATGIGRPPRVLFSWGRVFNFAAVITSFSINYTLFLSDGKPVRARVSLSLQECEDSSQQSPQNPTTQGTIGNKIHIVKPGDTLDRIAYQEYKKSSAWRFIADTNNLDNPRDLRPGQALAIRPLQS